jgi:hypothetical protein
MATSLSLLAAAAAALNVAAAASPVGARASLKDCTVMVGPGAGPGERFAAVELSLFGGNISNGNVPLPIRGNVTPPAAQLASGGPAPCTIAVGHAAAIAAGLAPTAPAALSPTNMNDGYVIASVKPGAWAITGADSHGRWSSSVAAGSASAYFIRDSPYKNRTLGGV